MHQLFSWAARGVLGVALSLNLFAAEGRADNALDEYLKKPDAHFNWKRTESKKLEGAEVVHLELLSQVWREQFWSHDIQIVRPTTVRHSDICLLFITGSGDGARYIEMLKTITDASGAMAAVLADVPNQPLYDGKNEDALIAYTFEQFARTRDKSWPVLFPMVKSAVKAMDAIQQHTEKAHQQKVTKFVVTGASKRGWTTWLTGATDPRVVAIAPMVFDMLNFKAQTDWAQAMYGRQSEQIADYTELNLVERMNSPELKELRSWVDPYEYAKSYTMPKLILIGTNDRYWVVDSLRHYWNDLPQPKWIFQTPNAGHDLDGGREAIPTLAAWYQMIADGEQPPSVQWQIKDGPEGAQMTLIFSQKPEEVRAWTAKSTDRDLRDDKWESAKLPNLAEQMTIDVPKPEQGYVAYLGEAVFKTKRGHRYKLSTEARVTPREAPSRPNSSGPSTGSK
ncbi:MAG TPA: PhoPQ-activated protein PqaA family protein [Methylomirabilota bacterium]|nr:PhoPQ-activated protein PqaA family protein [Methylomirabilota bacterium]